MGLPPHRKRGCRINQLQVVLLLRERPLWNKNALLRIMREAGIRHPIVTSIDAGTPYQNQVDLFYSADLMISIHGSQLQNLQFMQPGSYVLEIFPKMYYHTGQQMLARWTGVRFLALQKSTFPSRAAIKKNDHSHAHIKALEDCQEFQVHLKTAKACMKHDPCR